MEYAKKKTNKKRHCRTRKIIGVILLVLGLLMLVPTEEYPYLEDNIGFCLVLVVPAIILFITAFVQVGQWDKIEKCLEGKNTVPISYIADSTGVSVIDAAARLRKMINLNFFEFVGGYNAVIDEQNMVFVRTRNGRPLDELTRQNAAQAAKDAEELRKKEAELEAERKQSANIRAIRDAIAKTEDQETVKVLRDLQKSVADIENTLIAKPELAHNNLVVRLREGYMPDVLNIIGKLNEEFITEETKNQIIDTIKVCTEAFKNINGQLNEGDNIATQVDMEVLRATLQSEGLLDSDFDL